MTIGLVGRKVGMTRIFTDDGVTQPVSVLREFRAKVDELANLKVGGKVGVELFKVGQLVDVQGVSIGKGFAGVIKRHHFGGQNASHGNSISHRVPGSTGQNQSPSHVFKGKRMPGHLGNVRRTILNLEIVRIDAERQLLLVKGSVPGSSGRDVVVRSAIKGQRTVVKQQPKAAPTAGKPAAKPAAAAKPQPAKA
jgi:large subunit ribosomal protein L3